MKGNAIVRILIYSVAIVALLGIMLSATAANLYFTPSVVQTEVPAPTAAPREINQYDFTTQIQNIEIDWVAGSIAIHPSDSLSNIIVEERSPAESQHNMVVKQSGQTLKIEFAEDHVKFDLFATIKLSARIWSSVFPKTGTVTIWRSMPQRQMSIFRI